MIKLILVRGLPGSGKSTLAAKMASELGAVHLEADQYFMEDGEYRFDPSRLANAHAWCLRTASHELMNAKTVIVSNTFTTSKELRPYFEIARALLIKPEVIACREQYGSIHNVPEETLKRMSARWEDDISHLFKE